MDGNKEARLPNLPPGAVRDPGNKLELHMTFLPKSAEARQELLALLIAIPVSLMGTGFFFYLLDGANRLVV
jgi:hypothetical protein